ncbi:MAG: clostripain-related cysteine peptidase [Allomuricauda sp.]
MKTTTILNNILIICSIFLLGTMDAAAQEAEWTVMVFLNADNNLESFGIQDFEEMSRVPKSEKVNILVQMDRSPNYTEVYDNWDETLRFKIEPEIRPVRNSAVQNLGEINMGDPKALRDFINWGISNYPAKKYALIIWDHGDGWRFNDRVNITNEKKSAFLADLADANIQSLQFKQDILARKTDYFNEIVLQLNNKQKALVGDLENQSISLSENEILLDTIHTGFNSQIEKAYKYLAQYGDSLYRSLPQNQYQKYADITNDYGFLLKENWEIATLSNEIEVEKTNQAYFIEQVRFSDIKDIEHTPTKGVSNDDTSNDFLYNKEIEDTLELNQLDIIGFDACLMSMLEIAYTLNGKAKFIVGSEELEPGAGWKYDFWLTDLVSNPLITPRELSANIVQNYGKAYPTTDQVTLSSFNLSFVDDLSNKIDELSKLLISKMNTERNNIRRARELCRKYAPYQSSIHSIDFALFLYHLEGFTDEVRIKGLCEELRDLISVSIVENFHSYDRGFYSHGASFGSFGMAIYFPKRIQYLDRAYNDANSVYPVSFVKKLNWDNFLQEYFRN